MISRFRSPPVLAAAAVLLVTLVTFVSCVGHGFVNWDDDVYLTKNLVVQRITAENVGRNLTGFTSGNYHPMVLLAYTAEFRLFGMDPRGYHAVSLLLHLANTLLVFLLLRRLDRRLVVATAGAALFALHPMRVESVAWISDQKDLLAAIFSLSALLAWVRWRGGIGPRLPADAPEGSRPVGVEPKRESKRDSSLGSSLGSSLESSCEPSLEPSRGSGRAYVAALVFFVLACGAKGTMIVLPVMFVLLDLLRDRKINRRKMVDLAPFFAASVTFGLLAVAARRSYESILMESRYGPVQDLFFGAHRLVFYYLARTLWPPAGRAALYPTLGDVGSVLPPGLIPATLLTVGLLVVLVITVRRARTVAFGLAFFMVGLVPSLTLPNLGYSADRFSYLPSIGLSLVAGIAVASLGWRRRIMPWVMVLPVIVLFSALSARQCDVWKDSVSLWTDAIASYPDTRDTDVNRAMAHVSRGRAQSERQAWDAAVADFTAALQIRDDIPDARYERALAHEAAGRKDLALADLDYLLATQPDNREAILHAARLRFERGDYAESLRLSLRAETLGARVNPEVLEFLRARVGEAP